MRSHAALLMSALLFSPLSQAEPLRVPASRIAYVGDWHGKDMDLNISEAGKIIYKRISPNKKVDINIDLVSFDGDNFNAGFALFNTTFVVTKPPHLENKKMKMVVDGVELTKAE